MAIYSYTLYKCGYFYYHYCVTHSKLSLISSGLVHTSAKFANGDSEVNGGNGCVSTRDEFLQSVVDENVLGLDT